MFNQHKSVSLYETIRFPLGVISRIWILDYFVVGYIILEYFRRQYSNAVTWSIFKKIVIFLLLISLVLY